MTVVPAGQPNQDASPLATDALLNLLLPFWQLVIGGLVLVALVGSVGRLARRGPSRMTTGLLVSGAALLGLAIVGVLISGR